VRRLQKTENKADRQVELSLEDQRALEAYSATDGERTVQNGNQFVDKVLNRNNLNLAYLRVKRNKGAGGIDGMTVQELGDYLKEHRQKLLASLRDGTYQPRPVRRVENNYCWTIDRTSNNHDNMQAMIII